MALKWSSIPLQSQGWKGNTSGGIEEERWAGVYSQTKEHRSKVADCSTPFKFFVIINVFCYYFYFVINVVLLLNLFTGKTNKQKVKK